MGNKISVVPYSERYREAHKVFASRNWPGKRRRQEENYIRWKFRGPAQGEVEGCLLAVKGDEVVGQVGLIPVDICAGSRLLSAQWICDFMADASMRRQGVGSLLLETLMSRPKVSLGSNPSESADGAMTRIGFRHLKAPSIMILPVRLNHVLSWKVPHKIKFLIPLLSQLGRPIMAWRSRELRKSGRQGVIKRCSWHEVAPLIEERQKLLSYPYVVHDQAFLKWRCTGLTGFSAKLYVIATDAGGYAIIEEAGPYLNVQD